MRPVFFLIVLLAGSAYGQFIRLPVEHSGVDFVNPLLIDHPKGFLYISIFGCGGVAAGDVNGDGRPDLFFTSGPAPNALFLNQGGMRFEKASFPEAGNPWSSGATMVDIDSDGDLDLYVCNYESPNQLWLNDGSGTFREVAADWQLALTGPSVITSFCDYDRDGDLDLFLENHRSYFPQETYPTHLLETTDGITAVAPKYRQWFSIQDLENGRRIHAPHGHPNQLLRQDLDADGRASFVDVTKKSGIAGIGHTISAVWWDYDGDGWPDLYESNDYIDPDRLYRNLGDGTFANVTEEMFAGVPWSSMGVVAADFTNDGRLDLFTTDMAATTHQKAKISMGEMVGYFNWLLDHGKPRQAMRNHFHVNTGAAPFLEAAWQAGIATTDWTWTPCAGDFDQDGRVDLFITNGMARFFTDADSPAVDNDVMHKGWTRMRDKPALKERNLAYRNKGDLAFEEVSQSWGLDHEGMSYASIAADLDGDGDLDLVTSNLDEVAGIYENKQTAGHWLQVSLKGDGGNRFGLGATVRITDHSGAVQVRQLHPVSGFQSCTVPVLHFGLGETTELASLEVAWPDGRVTRQKSVPTNQRLVIDVKNASPATRPSVPPRPLFRLCPDRDGLDFTHVERPHNDYAMQPLLPGKLSQFGPGMAIGDVDGDGRSDLYLGGAAGQAGALFLWKADGFVRHSGPWEKALEQEDLDAHFFDADHDGDLDLYVACGSVEHDSTRRSLNDLLYLNDGTGKFEHAPDALPSFLEYSSVIAPGDVNGDGWSDLFIGSRAVAGAYPRTPPSRLLVHHGKDGPPRFTDRTEDLAPSLRTPGLITGAQWIQLDADPEKELVLASEWSALSIYDLHDGRLEPHPSSLSGETGWWTHLDAADLDGDGDQDLIACNVGWNTKYGRPSHQKSVVLYYGSMKAGGKPRLIEAKPGDTSLLPVRGRSCSSNAMPFLRDKFPTYRAFANATLGDIYEESTLSQAKRYEAVTLSSGVFINEGGFRFRFLPFPAEAQLAPIYDTALGDWNGDGSLDLLVIQGLSTREPETGLWHGASGLLLTGDGQGQFTTLDAAASGFSVPGDGRALAILRHGKETRVVALRSDAAPLVFEWQAPE